MGIESNTYMSGFLILEYVEQRVCKAQNSRRILSFAVDAGVLAKCKIGALYQCHRIQQKQFFRFVHEDNVKYGQK